MLSMLEWKRIPWAANCLAMTVDTNSSSSGMMRDLRSSMCTSVPKWVRMEAHWQPVCPVPTIAILRGRAFSRQMSFSE